MKTQFLTPKLKRALAASLSVVIAFLFPLYYGIIDTTSAAMTVMVIATTDTLGASLAKGFFRVIGTIIGAVIGITLIALFPQERFLYFFFTSLFVFILMYLARAFRGDKTIFLLTAMTMMIVFKGGSVDNIYTYAIEKTLLTIIGIIIYTLVSIYLFPTPAQTQESQKNKWRFMWGDKEDIKGAIISFLVYWSTTLIWIYFEIPNGYFITILATSFSLYTTYSIVKPKILIILFSISFIIAALSYIFILPHLNGWWELALFIFVYSFIGFYFINPLISIFYLLGLTTFMIQNQMFYSIELFMFILLLFYMFLFILLFFDYFPFNQKSNFMFLQLKDRLLESIKKEKSDTLLEEIFQKLQIYAKMIDHKYYETTKEEIESFLQTCQKMIQTKQVQSLQQYQQLFLKLQEGRF